MKNNEGDGNNSYYKPKRLLEYKEPVPFPGTIKRKKSRLEKSVEEWLLTLGIVVLIFIALGVLYILFILFNFN